MRRRATLTLGLTLGALLAVVAGWPGAADPPAAPAGRSVTLLPDGRWLLLGGETGSGVQDTVEIWDARTQITTRLNSALQHARAWHSATVLPDGRVLILGGIGADGRVVDVPEVFVPATSTVDPFPGAGPTPRIGHTATVLTDGQLLVTGGLGLDTAELWDPGRDVQSSVPGTLGTPRARHAATLLATGEVLLSGGIDAGGRPIAVHEIYDPAGQGFAPVVTPPADPPGDPTLTGSLPADGATDVPVTTVIGLRFSTPLRVETLTPQTVFLSGPSGLETATVVPAEGGRLVFIVPDGPLAAGTSYTVSLNGPTDAVSRMLPLTSLMFTTRSDAPGAAPGGEAAPPPPTAASPSPEPSAPRSDREAAIDDEVWVPTSGPNGWRTNRPPSPWEALPLLQADPGITALAGRVLTLAGTPLPHVTLEIAGRKARSDSTGRFLLRHVPPDHQELLIDGRTASRPGRTFGVFEVGVVTYAGRTIGLPYTIWMPRIDTDNAVTIASPTIQETVVTTPHIPGLEVRIPAGTTITDHEHRPVAQISLTPMPLDRPPFPLPAVEPPAFFTIQPGGGYVYGRNGGVRVIYPNRLGWEPGSSVNFWHYDTSPRGWFIYGKGTVTADATQAVPDSGVAIYEFTAAMVEQGIAPPADGGRAGNPPEAAAGEPVDLPTGLFVMEKTDLALGDILPIRLTRTYRTRDSVSRPFGRGATHPYAIFVRTLNGCQDVLLVRPDGSRIRFVPVSGGPGCTTNIVLEHAETPTPFFKARMDGDGPYWRVTLKDGTVYRFIQTSGALTSIQDRFGNWIKLSGHTSGAADPKLLETSTGRWLRFTYDGNGRITQVQDNIGRTVAYTYDASGRLASATDAAGGVTEYTYDAFDRMLTIKDPRNIVYLTNEYDAAGRVIKQTQADGTTFLFSYTLDGVGSITQADVTDPRGFVRRVTFNAAGYVMTNARAVGHALQQTATWERQTGTNLVTAIIDPLSRRTEYTYDSKANLLTVTRLAGTGDAVTTTYTYEPTFNQMASVTDPLSHTTSLTYDSKGALATITNPLSHQTTITTNPSGQPTQVSAALGVTVIFTYENGDLITTSDALGNTTRRFPDGAGRVLAMTDPRGQITRYEYTPLNRLTTVTDPNGGVTAFTYDPNGNLLTMTDARGGVTSYTYNSMDRLASRTDPLLRQETYQYDPNGNVSQFTDRKSQTTTYTYDALDRRTQTSDADGATTDYSYDAGHRLTTVLDSIAGTMTRTYDGLNRLTQEVTPEGTVSYTYDAASRRATMTVLGQPTVSYTYNNADRLTQIAQNTSITTLAYDAVSRRTALTLPNGIVVEYAHDTASRVTGLTYRLGTTTLGALTYTYDTAGNRRQVGGSWARTNLPDAVSTTSYNAGNRQLTFGPNTMTYDNNGNLSTRTDGGGTTTLTWDARDRLTTLTGPGLTGIFRYDGFDRRRRKVIDGVRTDFLYDGLNPVQEKAGSTVLANILGLGIDEYLTRTDATGTRHILPDALGSIVALNDPTGTVSTEYTYEPFGRTTVTGSANASAFQYTGRENDGTGLYYYRARYYQPGLARFISEDPYLSRAQPDCPGPLGLTMAGPAGPRAIRSTQKANLYGYVLNAPTGFRDPLGLQEIPYRYTWYWWCPPAPPGYEFERGVPEFEPVSACIYDALTGQVICGPTLTPPVCTVRCYYRCVDPGGRKDCPPPLELPGTCATAPEIRP
jgi:RHS repeat-associated protein